MDLLSAFYLALVGLVALGSAGFAVLVIARLFETTKKD